MKRKKRKMRLGGRDVHWPKKFYLSLSWMTENTLMMISSGRLVAHCAVVGRSRVRGRAVAGLCAVLAALPECYHPIWA